MKKSNSFVVGLGVVLFTMLAGMIGVLIGAFLLYSPAGQAVLGVATP
jgi:hypothetical protein